MKRSRETPWPCMSCAKLPVLEVSGDRKLYRFRCGGCDTAAAACASREAALKDWNERAGFRPRKERNT